MVVTPNTPTPPLQMDVQSVRRGGNATVWKGMVSIDGNEFRALFKEQLGGVVEIECAVTDNDYAVLVSRDANVLAYFHNRFVTITRYANNGALADGIRTEWAYLRKLGYIGGEHNFEQHEFIKNIVLTGAERVTDMRR